MVFTQPNHSLHGEIAMASTTTPPRQATASSSAGSRNLAAIGVGIDTARYGHMVSFLRPDRQPAAQKLLVLVSFHEEESHIFHWRAPWGNESNSALAHFRCAVGWDWGIGNL
jgi:hypothetical protein